jgi:hypothetical protein
MRIDIHGKVILKYIYTNLQHKNPLCRVASINSSNNRKERLDYDKEKYKEMILDAAETVLCYFGFDRLSMETRKTHITRKCWWVEELIHERGRDIRIETMNRKQ